MIQRILSETTESKTEVPVTVVILTFNEQDTIGDCLRNVKSHFSDVIVLDSGSTDRTKEIVADLKIPLFENSFSGFGDQRNHAIDQLPHRYRWCLHLDADERVNEKFVDAVNAAVTGEQQHSGFFVPNRLMLGDQWLRYSSGYPIYQVRLFDRERLRFINWGHGQREVTDGSLGYLSEPYDHHAFQKGLVHWMQKHAEYAASEIEQNAPTSDHRVMNVLSRDGVVRRRAIKHMLQNAPMRGWLRMVYTLVLKRGILDGRAGWTYARMLRTYEEMYTTYRSAARVGLNLRR